MSGWGGGLRFFVFKVGGAHNNNVVGWVKGIG